MLSHGSNWRIPADIHEMCLGGPDIWSSNCTKYVWAWVILFCQSGAVCPTLFTITVENGSHLAWFIDMILGLSLLYQKRPSGITMCILHLLSNAMTMDACYSYGFPFYQCLTKTLWVPNRIHMYQYWPFPSGANCWWHTNTEILSLTWVNPVGSKNVMRFL